MRLTALGLALGALALPGAAQAESPARMSEFGRFAGGSVAVEAFRAPTGVALVGVNRYRCPITLDLAIEGENLAVGEGPRTITLGAEADGPLASLRRLQEAGTFSYRYHFTWTFGSPKAVHDDTVYGLPFTAGSRFEVAQGYNGAFSHAGVYAVDFAMPEGTPVRAAREGRVLAFNDQATGAGTTPEYKDNTRANWVLVGHQDGTIAWYYHLRPRGVVVAPGQPVHRGQLLAYSGNTGFSTQPHLHFEVRSPLDGSRYRSWPVRFHAREYPTPQSPVEGRAYTAL